MSSATAVRDADVAVRYGDVEAADLAAARRQHRVALDIETSGLDWRSDRIATCQLHIAAERVVLVRVTENQPQRLIELLTDVAVEKVFHHALFDLRFMAHAWDLEPSNIACTKVAAKLLDPLNIHSHSLGTLLDRHLGLRISKREARSNWFASELTHAQIAYAADDVLYLGPLMDKLGAELVAAGLWNLAQRCFEHIPTRVELEVRGYQDVYCY
ncbi:MAG: ribonuclease D [Armatimonadetes bacterium]|nr:ribonuclease D [Armatimonadota bacterium]